MADDSTFTIETPSAANGIGIIVDRTLDPAHAVDRERQAEALKAAYQEINSLNIDPQQKAALLSAIMSGGNLTAILAAAQADVRDAQAEAEADHSSEMLVSSEAIASEAREQAAEYLSHSSYKYSAAAEHYITTEMEAIYKDSPYLQDLEHQKKMLPAAELAVAEKEQHDNAKQYEAMRNDLRYAAFKADMEDSAKWGLITSEKGGHYLAMIKEYTEHGVGSPEAIHALKEQMIKHRIALGQPVIDSIQKQFHDGTNHTIGAREMADLEAAYPNGKGSLDGRRIMADWAHVQGTKEADDAFAAYDKTGKDISKLNEHDRKIIELSKVAFAVDMAAPIQATLEITGRNQAAGAAKEADPALAAKLQDSSIPAEERGELLKAYMDRNGMPSSKEGISNAIEALDSKQAQEARTHANYNEVVGQQYVAAYADDFASTRTGTPSYFAVLDAAYDQHIDSIMQMQTLAPLAPLTPLAPLATLSPTVAVPDTTVAVPDTTVAVPDTTVAVPDTTVAVPDTTVAVPDTTVAVPDTTVAVPDTTVAVPDTTVAVPDTTVAVPDTTVAVPDTTVAVPDTTVAVPDTTVAVPDTTVAVPDTTVAVPDTTVAVPDTTVAVPDTTVAVPDTTVAVPDTTVAVPDTTVAVPDTTVAVPDTAVATNAEAASATLQKIEPLAALQTIAPIVAAKDSAPEPATSATSATQPAATPEPAKSAIVAGTAFVPPPGLDVSAIPSLAALGITGGQNAGANTGAEVAMQNVKDIRVAGAGESMSHSA